MSKKTPEAPKPPDYAAANEAAVRADISTLPTRNAINAASTLGTRYVDPVTGQVSDFTGLGSQDIAHAQLMQQLADAPESARVLLELQQRYGGDFAQSARDQLRITDPEGFALRQQMGGRLGSGEGSIESLIAGLAGNAPDYERIGGAPGFADRGQAAAGRGMLEGQIFDELARAGTPDAALQRSAEQAARARSSSRGNILGDASALQESLGVQLAQRDLDNTRRSNALSLLSSGQTASDKGNSLADQNFQAAMAAINQRNQATQNQFGAQQGLLQQRVGARQQDLANQQSFLGLQPIVSQGGQLAGLQQGAAPFMPGTGYQAGGVNQNAGALGTQFAGNVFGTQANMYGAQLQNSQSPLGAILGSFAGAASGGAGTAVGTKLGGLITCHVAREVYGSNNPEWVVFYVWKENMAPSWFRRLYNRFSRPVAALIRPFPRVKASIRRWMDSKTKGL